MLDFIKATLANVESELWRIPATGSSNCKYLHLSAANIRVPLPGFHWGFTRAKSSPNENQKPIFLDLKKNATN